ncbi:GNAT family N-acetyltransferase [Flavobacteriaceae bacterium]|nr:GNAT family N-acetyltransferase [Flavobacteriaceae bacterium]
MGYSLLPEFWNKGLATEAAKKCRDYALKKMYQIQ